MIHRYLILCLIAIVWSSCASTKKLQTTTEKNTATAPTDTLKWAYNREVRQINSVEASTTFVLQRKEKTDKQVKGRMSIVRNKGVLLSVAPFLGISVAELYIAPQGITLVDHLNGQYVSTDFEEISRKLNLRLDYHIIQALFLNELFLFERNVLQSTDMKQFKNTSQGDLTLLSAPDYKNVQSAFLVAMQRSELLQTRIGLRNALYHMLWKYSDFGFDEKEKFPRNIQIELAEQTTEAGLQIQMRRCTLNNITELNFTHPDSSYKRVSLDEVLHLMMSKL